LIGDIAISFGAVYALGVRKKLNLADPAYGRATNSKIALWKITLVLLLIFALPLVWRWTPLHEWINLDSILEWQISLRNNSAAPIYVIAAYLIGSLVFFPITVLTLATVFAFGPVWGNIYAMLGWILSAAAGYCLGRRMGHAMLHKIAGERISRLIDRVAHHGFLAVLALRLLPAAPFNLVNMFIGASDIRFRDFLLASVVGRIPGIFTLALFGVQLERALRAPGPLSFTLLATILIAVPFVISRLLKRLHPRELAERRRVRPRVRAVLPPET
jgi:phospholipase D1/2